jgi:hypothetical protein
MSNTIDYDRLDEVANAALGFDTTAAGEVPLQGFDGFDGFTDMGESIYPEGEGDQFLGKLIKGAAGLVRRAIPALGKLLPQATQAVQGSAHGSPAVPQPQDMGPQDDGGFGSADGGDFGPDMQEDEDEDEDYGFDGETGLMGEDEDEAGLMAESMLSQAARAMTDQEAAALASGITITITSSAPIVVRRITPVLAKGAANIVRVLRQTPSTRPLVPVVGQITKATTRVLTKRANAGKAVTPAIAARVMAQQTAKMLSKPSKVAKALVKNAVSARKLDQQAIRRSERFN